jgi:beta-ribofuranosylaminobenzene 5'-phosphate synthase
MKVYVKSPARLHFGLIDLNGEMGRFFGGLGVAIDQPNVILEAQNSDFFSVTGKKSELVKVFANRFFEKYGIKKLVSIDVKQTIPEHQGLGSGTQLALAVSVALKNLFHVDATVKELSLAMGRMKRTGVGTVVFEQGGFVLDGGKRFKDGTIDVESVPPLIMQTPFPEDWTFVVVIPNIKKGLAMNEEKNAFKRVSTMPSDVVGNICWLTMMKLLPSLVDYDIVNFGSALTQIQKVVGNFFADVQGGTYASLLSKKIIDFMDDNGAYGVGQSSWGPAVYGLVEDKIQAANLKSEVNSFLKDIGEGRVFIAKANNQGAIIKKI